jgi:hypothetical protein
MTETKEKTNSEKKFDRSEFGKCLYELMQSRDLFTATALEKEMKSKGKDVTDRLIRQLWSRKSRPGIQFMQDVGEVLKLTIVEKARLSTSVYYDEEWRKIS